MHSDRSPKRSITAQENRRGGWTRHRALTVEPLEARRLLSTFNWVGGTSGEFNVAANWQGPGGSAGVPGPSDDAVVNTSGVTIQIDSDVSINSLNTASDTIVNLSSGSLTLAGGNAINSAFANLNVSAGAKLVVNGANTYLGSTTSAGEIDVNAGQLFFYNGADVISGPINAAQSASVQFGSGAAAVDTATFNTGVALNGAGLYTFQYSTYSPSQSRYTLNTDLAVQNLTFAGGTIQSASTLTVSGAMTWTGGGFSGTGALLISQGSILNIPGPNSIQLQNGFTFDNAGMATISQSGDEGSTTSAVINNSGTFVIQPGVVFGLTSTTIFNNTGTLTANGGTGLETSQFTGTLNNTGVVNVETGVFETNAVDQDAGGKLTGGTWNISAGATFDINNDNVNMPPLTENDANVTLGGAGATFTNFGTLTTNAGSLTLGPGAVLNLPGTFTQTSTGTLTPQIGGSSDSGAFGQLAATGAVTLGGALDLDVVNNYAPTVADSFAVLTYPSVTGTFAQINTPTSGPGQALGARVTPTQVLVSASSASSPADLDLQSVSITLSSGLPGDTANVTWNVTNTGAGAAFGAWQDAVYLSTTPTLDASAMLLAVSSHTGGLNAGSSYQGSATITLPALPPGPVYAIVVVDRYGVVLEGSTATLVAVSAQPYNVNAVPTLTLGTPTTGSFSAANQDRYYQVTVSAGESLVLSLDSQASGGSLLLSTNFDVLPGPSAADESTQGNFAPNQLLVISPTRQGTYYVDVHSQDGAAATTGFTLTATTPGFGLTGVSPSIAGAGPVTLAVSGTGLTSDTTYSLVGPTGSVAGSLAQFVDGSLAYVTFNLTGQAAGSYSLRATPPGGNAVVLGSAVTVTPASIGGIDLAVSGPSEVRNALVYPVVVTYTNTGNADVPAPIIDVNDTSSIASIGLDPTMLGAGPLQILGIAPNGPAGILRAGQQGQFTVYVRASIATAELRETLVLLTANDITADDTTPMDYNNLGPILRPDGLTDAQWNAEYAAFQQMVGPTEGDYVQALDDVASLVPAGLIDPTNTVALALIELDRASVSVGNSITGVLTTTDARASVANQIVAATDAAGDVFTGVSLDDGSFFLPNVPSGTYTLSIAGAVFQGSSTVTVTARQVLDLGNVQISLGGVISGVISSPGGVAVANASIQALDTTGDGSSTSSDNEGRYTLSGLMPGTYTLSVVADGLAIGVVSGVVVNGDSHSQNVVLSDQSVITGEVTLQPGGPTGGSVFASVVPSDSTDPTATQVGTSIDGSSFTIANLAPGTYDVTVGEAGYISQTISGVVIGQGGSTNLGSVALSPAATISGTVVSTDPAAPAAYAAVGAFSGSTLVAVGISDANGDFQIGGLPAGQYTFGVAGAVGTVTGPTVTLTAGQSVTGVTVNVAATTGISADRIPSSQETREQIQSDISDLNDQIQQAAVVTQKAHDVLSKITNTSVCSDDAKKAKQKAINSVNALLNSLNRYQWDAESGVNSLQQAAEMSYSYDDAQNATLLNNIVEPIVANLQAIRSASAGLAGLAYGDYNAFLAAVVADDCSSAPPQIFGGIFFFATAAQPGDPNEKTGPGFGTQGFVAAGQTLPYVVTFENSPKEANAPALEVIVTDQLDKNLDWTTFSLGTITFGSNVIEIPSGLQTFSTTVATTNTDGTPLNVVVTASLDLSTGLATWTFLSVDPATGQFPLGAQDGFLPVEDGTGRGIGSIDYTIKPKAGLPNGATFSNSATVVFDTNAPITTNSVPGTIDSVAPTSSVNPLPATESTPSFTVNWSGTDAGGAGIATYNVYVSTNGGAFVPFQTNTTATSARFTGQSGDNYAFYSVATDNIGHVQPTPTMAQAVTTVAPPAPVITLAAPSISGTTFHDTGSFTSQGFGPFAATVDYGDTSGLVPLALSAAGGFTLSHTYASPGTYMVTVGVKNGAGIVGYKTLTVTVTAPLASGYGAGRDAFVTTLYRLDFGRLPEPSGLRYWSARLAAGVSPKAVALAIWNSPERRVLVNLHLSPSVKFVQSYEKALFLGRQAAASLRALPGGPLAVAKASTARP